MISSSTDMQTMVTELDVHGAKLKLSLREAREVIVTLSNATMPLEEETKQAILKRWWEAAFKKRRLLWA